MFVKNESVKRQIKLNFFVVLVLDIIFYIGLCLVGNYSWSNLFGVVLGSGYGVFNFVLIAISAEKLVLMSESKVKMAAMGSYLFRYLLMFLVASLIIWTRIVNVYAFLISLFFSKIAIPVQVFLEDKIYKN